MTMIEKKPITARVQADLLNFLEEYQAKHDLPSKTDALEEAIRSLREREHKAALREGYRQMAIDQANTPENDPWIDSDLKETLEGIDRGH